MRALADVSADVERNLKLLDEYATVLEGTGADAAKALIDLTEHVKADPAVRARVTAHRFGRILPLEDRQSVVVSWYGSATDSDLSMSAIAVILGTSIGTVSNDLRSRGIPIPKRRGGRPRAGVSNSANRSRAGKGPVEVRPVLDEAESATFNLLDGRQPVEVLASHPYWEGSESREGVDGVHERLNAFVHFARVDLARLPRAARENVIRVLEKLIADLRSGGDE